MAAATRCVICLNSVKEKLKLARRHSLEEQLVITFLLRKIMWTPISNDNFREYLQAGSPSEWVALCHICEKQVKEALDIHRQVMRLINRISEIRRKLYTENFYESDDEDEENHNVFDEGSSVSKNPNGSNQPFVRLRRVLISDYESLNKSEKGLKQSVCLKYHMSKAAQNTLPKEMLDAASVAVKLENMSDEDHFSDSMQESMNEPMDLPSMQLYERSEEFTRNVTKHKMDFDNQSDSDENRRNLEYTKDPPWKERKQRKPRIRKRKARSMQRVSGEPLPESVPENTTECPVCMKTFISRTTFKRHYKETHLNFKDFVCPTCSQEFARKTYLEYHIRQLHPEKKLEIVRAGALEPEPLEFQCLHCPRKFNVDIALRRHVRRAHPTVRTVYGCNECGRKFERKDALSYHKRNDHGHGVKTKVNLKSAANRQCKLCTKVLSSKSSLGRHIREVHKQQGDGVGKSEPEEDGDNNNVEMEPTDTFNLPLSSQTS